MILKVRQSDLNILFASLDCVSNDVRRVNQGILLCSRIWSRVVDILICFLEFLPKSSLDVGWIFVGLDSDGIGEHELFLVLDHVRGLAEQVVDVLYIDVLQQLAIPELLHHVDLDVHLLHRLLQVLFQLDQLLQPGWLDVSHYASFLREHLLVVLKPDARLQHLLVLHYLCLHVVLDAVDPFNLKLL